MMPREGTAGGERLRLRLFLLAVGLLGVAGIAAVYSLRLNYPPIRSDGLGYYLYLPATFIYHELGLGSIADFFRKDSIPWLADSPLWRDSGPLLWEPTGKYLIKYPLGTAVMMAPFFFLACLVSAAVGAPLDGFSPIFQYGIALAGLFYLLAGLWLLRTLLRTHFREETVLVCMSALVFGTNLFHYATYDSVFSHVFSFFLFTSFLLLVQRVYRTASLPLFLLGGAAAGLIVVTRPTNILWLLFGILYGITGSGDMRERLRFWKAHAGQLFAAAALFLCILALQSAYWMAVTREPLLFSYRGERFYFLQPEIANVLFSVRKGLFFWSPILLTIFPGMYFLYRHRREYFLPAALFLPLNIYVIASWHSWFYGGSFGHRAFIESFPLFGVAFCALYEGCSPAARRVLLCITACCIALETWLMLKYWTGVIPFDGTTWGYFVRTFPLLVPR